MQKKIITIFIIILVIIIFIKAINLNDFILKQFYPIKYSEYVEKYAIEYNVDKLLVYSIIKAESNFKEKAVSSSGAKGLMQLMNSTATEISDNDINEDSGNILSPETNIKAGVKYYVYLLNRYNGNMLLALTAYNAGIGNVDEWIANGIIKSDGSDIENVPFKETSMYVRKIINNYKIYEKLYQNS